MKKVFCLLLVLALLVPMLPSAAAEESSAATETTETTVSTEETSAAAETAAEEETVETAAAAEETTQATTLPAPAAAFPETTAESTAETVAETAEEAVEETAAETTAETAATEETVPAETEPEAVPVVFQCQPADAAVAIYLALEDAESQIQPLEDNPDTFLLTPGDYFYYIDCDGYQAVSAVPFTVEAGSSVLVIRVSLEEISGSVTVTYDPQGGTCAAAREAVAIGDTVESLPVPYREGWRFVGWFLEEGFSARFDEDTPVTQDTTVYAHWSLRYNEGTALSFDACGGDLPAALFSLTADEADGDGTAASLSIFTHAGDVISLEDTVQVAVNAAGRVTKTGTGLTVPEGGFVLSAPVSDTPTEAAAFVQSIGLGHYVGIHWNSMVVSVYGGRDGLLYNGKYALMGESYGALPTPIRESKTFDGWYTSPQGGEKITADTTFTQDSPTMLYAHWADECDHDYTADYHQATADGPGYLLYTCEKCGETRKVYFGAAWSSWSAVKPSNVSTSLVDSRTEYRCRVKETTVSTQGSLAGWTRCGTETVWGDYGDWSGWGLTPIEQTCYVQVETAPLYRYYCYLCSHCGARCATPGDCGCDANGAVWQELWSPTPYTQAEGTRVSGDTSRMSTQALEDGKTWYFASGNLEDTDIGTTESGGTAKVIRLGFRSRSRVKTTRYCFYRWSEWSDWTDAELVDTDNVDVQTRTAYRTYTAALPTTVEEDCAVCPDDEDSE